MNYSDKYMAFMGMAPKRIPHWEHWSNPDAESYLTGIDYFEHPRLCRQKMAELYPQLELGIPENDDPIPKPVDNVEQHTVRWGAGQSSTWEHGSMFKDEDDVFAFSPLEFGDFSRIPSVVEAADFSSYEVIEERYKKWCGEENYGKPAPEGSTASAGFYNTTFMWPLLTFGWDLFLQTCLDERFERIMDEFAEINRRVFRVMSHLPVNFIVCHDDIVNSRGPICSPEWMNKYVFPRYEEYWSMLNSAGKRVIFMVDGNVDQYADDIFACGASGIISEPYTDYKTIAKKHKDCFLAGEGDNRILSTNDKSLIYRMVDNMVETAGMTGGYMMCIGNHIPWNVPGEGIKYYLDYAAEKAVRN